MPKELERKLKKQLANKGIKPGTSYYDAYLYGTMRKTGWKPKCERKK